MFTPFAILALATSFQQSPVSNPCATGYTQNVWDPRFTPGQRWSYRARPLDKDSTLTITKIDYVPDIGLVAHISVDHVDFVDKPGDRPSGNYHTESFAIRRDSLDASALEMLGISQAGGPPAYYRAWQANCGGLTYGTTVADTLKTLQEAFLTRQENLTMRIVLNPTPTGKPQNCTLTLAQQIINSPFPQRKLEGQITYRKANPIKDVRIEISGHVSAQQSFTLTYKTNSEGTFSIPSIPLGTYTFKLKLDGFQSLTGTLIIGANRPSLSDLRSSD
jgi:hypothetical protein